MAGLTQSMGYAFNGAGQLSTVTTPSGRQVVYTYSNGRPVSVAVGGVSILSAVTYEPFGPNGGWVWGNSGGGSTNTHTRLHDKDYRTTRVTSDLPVSGSQPYFDKQFNWDQMSRITSIADLATSALNATYGYDALDRVTSASQGSASWGYTYNGIGDRLTSTVGAASTTYGYTTGTHRLASLTGAQSKSYTYDAVGNMTSDGTTTWVYGGNNRPTSAGSTAFLINALGQRVKKTTGSTATRFVYDEAGRLWGEYDAAGTLIQEIVWLDELPVAVLRANGAGTDIYYVHPDHLGTPRAITRATDNHFVWKWDNTEPFGNSGVNDNPSGLGSFAFNLRFPGQYWDSETGTAYNYNKDYDSALGRYIQSDPIGLRGGMSTYSYALSRPISKKDPLGLAVWICNRAVQGFPFAGNHGYLWDDRSRSACGMRGSSGSGLSSGSEKGPGPGGDDCRPVPGSPGKEDQIMGCCKSSANSGVWFPVFNDCHEAADSCIKGAGLANPGAPGGRLQPCDSCKPRPSGDSSFSGAP